MSETETPTPAEPEYVPQNVLSSEDTPAPEAAEPKDGEAEPKSEADPVEEQRRAERRREAARIGHLTKQRYAEKARADALEARLRDIEAQQQNGQERPLTREDFQQAVRVEAAKMAAQDAHNQRFNAWDAVGAEEFGQDKFRDACKVVAEMASEEQRQALASMVPDIEGGQKAIMELADHPDEAERILALPPHRMALALAKLAAPEPSKPKPVSSLPPPIRPPAGGRARGEPDPEKGSMEDYKRWSAKQEWSRY